MKFDKGEINKFQVLSCPDHQLTGPTGFSGELESPEVHVVSKEFLRFLVCFKYPGHVNLNGAEVIKSE